MAVALVEAPTERRSTELHREVMFTVDGTDQRLAARIEQELHATTYSALRVVEVVIRERVVELGGRVPSFHMKQMAQVIAMSVPGVRGMRNGLEVIPPTCVEDSHEV